MITQRAILVGIVGFCFYLIAIVNELPVVFYALTLLTVSILFSSLGIALLSLVGVECGWSVSGARVSQSSFTGDVVSGPMLDAIGGFDSGAELPATIGAGGPLVHIELANRGALNKTGVILEVQLASAKEETPLKRRFLLEALPSGAALAASLQLNDLPRGRYRVTGLRMIGADVLGLFRVQRLVPPQPAVDGAEVTEDIVIGPPTVALRVPVSEGGGSSADGSGVALRFVGNSDELRGTRPYVAGDDLRRVHWKSTARHGELVVKEFHRSTQSQNVVVWDGAAETGWGHLPITTTEYGLSMVASLCRLLVEQGKPCTLLRLDSNPLWIASTGPVRTTASHLLARITEALAEAEPDRGAPLAVEINAHLAGLSHGSNVWLITASLAPDVREAVLACVDRGARVRVALLDGAAFRAIGAGDHTPHLPASLGLHPRQHWDAGPDNSVVAGDRPVTREGYAAQVAALRESGIDVTLVPAPANGEVAETTLQQVLRDLTMPGLRRAPESQEVQPVATAAS